MLAQTDTVAQTGTGPRVPRPAPGTRVCPQGLGLFVGVWGLCGAQGLGSPSLVPRRGMDGTLLPRSRNSHRLFGGDGRFLSDVTASLQPAPRHRREASVGSGQENLRGTHGCLSVREGLGFFLTNCSDSIAITHGQRERERLWDRGQR